MVMIEIFVHLHPLEDKRFNNVKIPILFPIVPRVGEKLILSKEHQKQLLSLIDKKEVDAWSDVINSFIFVEEICYLSEDSSINVLLSN